MRATLSSCTGTEVHKVTVDNGLQTQSLQYAAVLYTVRPQRYRDEFLLLIYSMTLRGLDACAESASRGVVDAVVNHIWCDTVFVVYPPTAVGPAYYTVGSYYTELWSDC